MTPREQRPTESQEINQQQTAHIVALREALKNARHGLFNCLSPLNTTAYLNEIDRALSTPPPPVVPLKDVRMLVEALERILPEWHKEDNGTYANGQIAGEISVGDMRVAKKALITFITKHPL